jgi:hypothetical protein
MTTLTARAPKGSRAIRGAGLYRCAAPPRGRAQPPPTRGYKRTYLVKRRRNSRTSCPNSVT